MDKLVAKAEKLLDKAKLQLMLDAGVFITSIILQLRHSIDAAVPTAATNGKDVLYNPEFFIDIKEKERVGLMAHEAWHVVLEHFDRIEDRDPKMWNAAGDYVINLLLVKAGFEIPKNGLLDVKYDGMTTEEVYNYLMQNPDEQPDEVPEDILYVDGNDEQSDAIKEQVKEMIVNAYTQAQMANEAGELPAEIKRLIDDLINPNLDWKELLARFVDSHIKNDYSMNRPNKRFMPNHILPSMYSENINHLVFAVDTSGSITDEIIAAAKSEIKNIYTIFNPERLTVIDCDYEIRNVHEITCESDVDDICFTGGGGTSFYPVMNWCKETNTNVLVYFTDLYAEPITNNSGYSHPTLWVCYSECQAPEYGETIYCNIA